MFTVITISINITTFAGIIIQLSFLISLLFLLLVGGAKYFTGLLAGCVEICTYKIISIVLLIAKTWQNAVLKLLCIQLKTSL